jgi:deoxyribonuclease V
MKRRTDSGWPDLVEQWKRRQAELSQQLRIEPLAELPRLVAGADAALTPGGREVIGAAVVYDRLTRQIVARATARLPLEVPYVPGFLSFREGPAILAAIRDLRHPFGAILFDGQGLAHPRRCGEACHLGIELDVPAVGVAKSRLIGEYDDPGPHRGDFVPLLDKGEEIGCVLRTRTGVRPVYVSIGHRIDLAGARELVLACSAGCRLPEPTRQADILAARQR